MKKQNYLINEDTMYLMSIDNKGLIESKVGEVYGNGFNCTISPNKIIESNCRHYSQSYKARKELSKLLTRNNSKLPVIVDLFGSHIFFCTHSDRIIENCWFNIKHIDSYWTEDGRTRVRFDNNEEIEHSISFNSFNNQYLNALKLHYRFTLQKERAHQKELTSIYNYSMFNKSRFNKEIELVGEGMSPLYMSQFLEMNGGDEL